MASAKDALRRQRRKELDAKRSKSRIRLGSCLESWGELKETLGFSLHSELAQYLLDSHFSSMSSRFSDGKGVASATFFTTAASLQQLVLLVHSHSQQCTFPPSLRPGADLKSSIQADSGVTDPKASMQTDPRASKQAVPNVSTQADPKASIKGFTKAFIHAVPKVSMQSHPKDSVQANPTASKQTTLNLSTQAEPIDPIRADPTDSKQTVLNVSTQAEPTNSLHADPIASKQTVLNLSTQAEPIDPIRADPIASKQTVLNVSTQAEPNAFLQTHPKTPAQVQTCLEYICEGGHMFTWCPTQMEVEMEGTERGKREQLEEQEDAAPSGQKSMKEYVRKETKKDKITCLNEHVACDVRMMNDRKAKSVMAENTTGSNDREGPDVITPHCSGEDEEPKQDMGLQEGRDAVIAVLPPKCGIPLGSYEMDTVDCGNVGNENQSPAHRETNSHAIPNQSKRGRQRRADAPEKKKADSLRTVRRKRDRQQPVKDEVSQICSKRKRKATPKLILPCEFDGCWKIFSSRQYLNHHMKYQHFQQKTFTCSHPSCGKSFNFKKHLKEHEKLHSDQKDYICEFCARAFRTSSNLSIHRRIHTGEKPLQCEVCGFTCRQKASLNWHMRKHDAERSYQFPCEICGRRFEKRDNVTAHRSKSHPEHLTLDPPGLKPTRQEGDAVRASEQPSAKE